MYNIVKRDGKDVHLVIMPDKGCSVNSGLGSVRGARMAETSYSEARSAPFEVVYIGTIRVVPYGLIKTARFVMSMIWANSWKLRRSVRTLAWTQVFPDFWQIGHPAGWHWRALICKTRSLALGCRGASMAVVRRSYLELRTAGLANWESKAVAGKPCSAPTRPAGRLFAAFSWVRA
jgi:hypothetical protein